MQRRAAGLPVALFVVAMLALAAGLTLTATNKAKASTTASPAGQLVPVTSTVPVVINEVYDSDLPAQEYFELYNTSLTATVDLTSFVIYNSDVSPVGMTPLSRLLPAYRYLTPQQHLAIGPAQLNQTYVVGDGFNNAGDYLALVNSANDVIDVVNWGNQPNPGWYQFATFSSYYFYDNIPTMPSPGGLRSLSRNPDGRDTDSGLDWAQLIQSPGRVNVANTPTPGAGTATPTAGCEDRYEPDNNSAQAKVLEQNTEQSHSLCIGGGTTKDRDWFVFQAVGGKVYTMLTRELSGPVDTIITLYDAAGNVLAESDDYQPGQSLASRIDYTFATSGTYYLQVRDKRSNGGPGYTYIVGLSTTGALPSTGTATTTPTINPLATATPGVCYDAYEPDGVPETAKLLLIGTIQHHSICPTVDADWERFYARAGKVYTVKTLNLGVGLDTYMYIFDSDGRTILAQNDDGGDGVASRIDFYPQRDDWYYVQVKNAGDIGGPDQTYDLSLAVVPGVPQPPGTATNIIAPVVTVTGVAATGTAVPTSPPIPTPTQGAVQGTPTPRPLTTPIPQPPGPVATGAATTVADVTPVPPTAAVAPTGTTTGAGMPGVPNTGAPYAPYTSIGSTVARKVQPLAQQPPAAKASTEFAPLLFQLFYDANNNGKYDASEGIKGCTVLFLKNDAGSTPAGSLLTSAAGTGDLKLPVVGQKIFVPYLGIDIELTQFPQRQLHSFWLKPVPLPDRVP